MMSVELDHIADMLDASATQQSALSKQVRGYAATIRDAVWNTTRTQGGSGVFAYETNGYGGYYVMDDANVPSLASLPYLGFLDRNDSAYVQTKEVLYSRLNPYYAEGASFSGIGFVSFLYLVFFPLPSPFLHHPSYLSIYPST